MDQRPKWTPFWKQVFVVTGSSITIAQISVTMAYTPILLSHLKHSNIAIDTDDESSSWIASIPGIMLIVGNILIAGVMGKYGRRFAGLLATSLALIGWIWISLATSTLSFLLARSLQGINMGMGLNLSPIVIGEYSSPQYRGAFVTVSVFMGSLGTIFSHTLGAYLFWQRTALIIATISFLGVVIIYYSPESPSWLADQGRYDECHKAFRWLRGGNGEEELQKLIEASKIARELKNSRSTQTFIKNAATNFIKLKSLLMLREFYIPVIIMFHLYTMCQWCGLVIFSVYPEDYFTLIIESNVDFGLQITLLDISRAIANALGIYFMKNLRRRVLLTSAVGANVIFLFIIAIYAYAKIHNLLLFDHPLIGILLSHIAYMCVAIGAICLPIVMSAELFPLEFRSFAGGLTASFYSISVFLTTKTLPVTVKTFGMHGLFFIYGIITGYCLIITLLFLPETKDRTLQDIEDELRGKHRYHKEIQSVIPLASLHSI